jgi:hypothetical protein
MGLVVSMLSVAVLCAEAKRGAAARRIAANVEKRMRRCP